MFFSSPFTLEVHDNYDTLPLSNKYIILNMWLIKTVIKLIQKSYRYVYLVNIGVAIIHDHVATRLSE